MAVITPMVALKKAIYFQKALGICGIFLRVIGAFVLIYYGLRNMS